MKPLITLALFAAAASAHETWLLPDQLRAAKGADVTLELTSGQEFPNPDYPIKPARVEVAKVRLAGKQFPLKDPSSGEKALCFRLSPDREGLACV